MINRVFIHLLLGVTTALLLLAGCASDAATPQMTAPDAHAAATTGKLTLVDIRTPQEWRQTGVGEGALRIDMRQPGGPAAFANAVLATVGNDKSAPIALICRTGNRSSHMQKYLLEQGFTQVYNVGEGMAGSTQGPGWIRRGLPVAPCGRC